MGLFKDSNGQVVDVDDNFAAAQGYTPVDSAGYTEKSAADATRASDLAQHSGALGKLDAFATNFNRMVTLGGSDLIADKTMSDEEKRANALDNEANPLTGEAGGLVGALGAAATGFGPAGALSEGVGAVAEAGLARGGVAGTAQALGAFGTEGAAQSVGSYLGQTALADKDVTAEGLAASFEHGFEFGAGGGAVGLGITKGTMAARRLYARYADGAQGAEDAAIAFKSKAQEQFEADTASYETAKQKQADYKRATSAADRQNKYWDARVAEEQANAANPRERAPFEPEYTDQDLGVQRGPFEEPGAGPTPEWVKRRNGRGGEELGPTERFGPDQEVDQPAKPDWIARRQGAEGPAGPAEEFGPVKGEAITKVIPREQNPMLAEGESVPRAEAPTEPVKPNDVVKDAVSNADDATKGEKKSLVTELREGRRSDNSITRWLDEKRASDEAVIGKDGVEDWDALENAMKEFEEARNALDVLKPEGFDQVIKPQMSGVPGDFLSAPGPARAVLQGERAEAAASNFERANVLDDDAMDVPNIDDENHVKNFNEKLNQDIQAITRYEKASANLHETLGDHADPTGMELTKQFREAEDDAVRKMQDRTARAVDDAPDDYTFPATELEDLGPKDQYYEGDNSPDEQRGPFETTDVPEPTPQERVRYAKERKKEASAGYKKAKLDEANAKPDFEAAKSKYADQKKAFREETKKAAASKPGATDKAAGLGGILEMINIPGIPKLSDLPVIGPLLGAYLKFRLAKTAMGKLGLGARIPATMDAKVAASVARMRDSVAQAVDASIGMAQAGGKAIQYTAPKLAGVLQGRLYDDGQPDAKGTGIQELVAVRTRELAAYVNTPGAIEKDVRKQLPAVTDPDVLAAVEKQRRAQMEYLLKNAPTLPSNGLLQKTQFVPSAAESMSWARRFQAARMPLDVFLTMQKEKAVLSIEAAETLKAVYPLMYQQAQLRLIQRAAEIKASVPYQQRLKMSILYDVPLDSTMEPDNLALFQSSFAKPPPAPMPGAPGAPTPSIAGSTNVTALFQTDADRRAAR